jgi:TolB-like protein
VVVTPDSVYQVVASLRRILGDDPKRPTYIATVPRLGYRMLAPVEPWIDEAIASQPAALAAEGLPRIAVATAGLRPFSRRSMLVAAAIGAALLIALALFVSRIGDDAKASAPTGSPAQSIAVLAFLDLTEEMDQEYFGDAMAEDLIDQLSKTTLRVSPPRSSFHFKDKGERVGSIAAALNVAYVLDGSLRESGSTLRVTARLIRADEEFIVWSQTYERPLDEMPIIRDDIVDHVIKTLQTDPQSP